MTIIPIIINGKFLMIAAPKKQIKNSKHINAKIRMNQSFAFIFVDLFFLPVPYDKLLKQKRCGNILPYLVVGFSHRLGTDKAIAHTIRQYISAQDRVSI